MKTGLGAISPCASVSSNRQVPLSAEFVSCDLPPLLASEVYCLSDVKSGGFSVDECIWFVHLVCRGKFCRRHLRVVNSVTSDKVVVGSLLGLSKLNVLISHFWVGIKVSEVFICE